MDSFLKRLAFTPVFILAWAHGIYFLMLGQPIFQGNWLFVLLGEIVFGFWFSVKWAAILGGSGYVFFKSIEAWQEHTEAVRQRLERETNERFVNEELARRAPIEAFHAEQERLRKAEAAKEREVFLKEVEKKRSGPRDEAEAMKHAMDDITFGGIGK